MAISGLVITLEAEGELRREALAALGDDARLTLGELTGSHLPVVADTRSPAEGRALVEELFRRPGIRFVDVVCVDFSDEEL